MSAAARRQHSFAGYLELDERSNGKLEYRGGEIVAKAGETPEHAALAVNVGIALALVRDHGCQVFSSDLRVRVLATGLAAYPDVTVVCGPLERDPDSPTTVVNPTLVIEVLSDSTQDYDRGEKAEHYRMIPSLQACLLVSHQRPHVEVWQRDADGRCWVATEHGAGAVIELGALGERLAVDEVYRGVLS
jgi:Uma2 family endonuclease